MAKKISNYTINYIREGIEEYRKNCIAAIDDIKLYVTTKLPDNMEDFMLYYNKWLRLINDEYQTLKTSLGVLEKERYDSKDHGKQYEYDLSTGEKTMVYTQDQKHFKIYVSVPNRWWSYSQYRKEANFRNIQQAITFEDA